ncbi:TPA: hypothetical protein PTV43_002949 [Clostridium botulinum]|nr:hypothetical protein [Clostridium botulinum]
MIPITLQKCDGELIKRVNESDIGLILIDEFERADGVVFNNIFDEKLRIKMIKSIDYTKFNNMRELNKKIKDSFVQFAKDEIN